MFKPTGIMTPDQIFGLCQEIQEFIELPYKSDVVNEVVDRATKMESYMALTGKMLADAKHHVESLMLSTFLKAVADANDSKMATSTLNKYLDTLCKDYNYLVTWTERLNRASTHAVEFSRTLISKLKNESYAYGNR
jgi:hypothetical protein